MLHPESERNAVSTAVTRALAKVGAVTVMLRKEFSPPGRFLIGRERSSAQAIRERRRCHKLDYTIACP